MTNQSYTKILSFAQGPQEVFAAITNPRAWWGAGITGETAKQGGTFIYRHVPYHDTTQEITALQPGKKSSLENHQKRHPLCRQC